MRLYLITHVDKNLSKYLAGPDCGGDDGGHLLDERFGEGVPELVNE